MKLRKLAKKLVKCDRMYIFDKVYNKNIGKNGGLEDRQLCAIEPLIARNKHINISKRKVSSFHINEVGNIIVMLKPKGWKIEYKYDFYPEDEKLATLKKLWSKKLKKSSRKVKKYQKKLNEIDNPKNKNGANENEQSTGSETANK